MQGISFVKRENQNIFSGKEKPLSLNMHNILAFPGKKSPSPISLHFGWPNKKFHP